MRDARLLLTVLFLLGSLGGARPAIASEANSSPPSVTSHKLTCCAKLRLPSRQGIKLSRISAVRRLRILTWTGSSFPRPEWIAASLDPLSLSYAAALRSIKKKPKAMFARIIDYGQAALPSDSWREFEAVPYTGLIRTISYQHWKSGAQIDVDVMVQPTGEAQPLYWVRVYGWKRF